MKRSLCVLAALVLAAGCRPAEAPVSEKPPKPASGAKEAAKPVSIVGAELLLLDGPSEPVLQDGPEGIKHPLAPAKGPQVDNGRCHVCHVNFSDERLAVGHARANIGCEKCHGPSDAHCGDEGNVTAPTTLYAKADVDKSCKVCHPDDRLIEGAKSCPVVVDDDAKGPKYCTDCHGRHRMERRTVHWDKKTGKLLPKDAAL